MKLKRTPAERQLLARICYRAGIAKDELCRDSNKELSLAIDIHAQSVSDLVRKLEKDGLIKTQIDDKKANARTISPISQILIPYKENADRSKEIPDSKSKDFPYSPPKPESDLSGNSLDPISQILIPSKEIPYSLYKDKNLLKPSENLSKKKAVFSVSANAQTFYWSVLSIPFSEYDAWLLEWTTFCTKQQKKQKPPKLREAPPPKLVTQIKNLIESRVEGYYWTGKDGKAAQQLADKLRNAITSKRKSEGDITPCTDEDIINSLIVLLDQSAKLKEYYQFTDVPTLNSKFNEILTQLRIPRTQQAPGKPIAPAHATPEQRISKVDALFKRIDQRTGNGGGG
ncbi:hypothetical protein GO755_30585 [Spirosoma sp. HMF4905]|uniref:Uncharacterized protein n=1 Tax=Spirosoma arboris TaxID=2682092 RepID=A0A7K1SKY6_9BACT|nr:helix-turn-helix domain-containing protein [Spirosoma arboris]MVM34418.1 hypothetical protein [Spirosoma arboris]